jgi:hypothetical protein
VGTGQQFKDFHVECRGTYVERPGIGGAAVDPLRGEYSMSITNCRSQQQTVYSDSRIPAGIPELFREFITDGRGEAVSISDIAKLLAGVGEAGSPGFSNRIPNCSSRRLSHSYRSEEMGAAAAPVPGTVGLPRSVRADRLRRAIGVHEYPQPRVFHLSTRSAARAAHPPDARWRRTGPIVPGKPRRSRGHGLQRVPIRSWTPTTRPRRSDSGYAAECCCTEGRCLLWRNRHVALRDEPR